MGTNKLILKTVAIAILINITNIYFVNSQGGVSINTSGTSADPSAMLDISGSSKGLLINRMTTGERNAILSPAEGLLIYNTTTRCFETFIPPIWQSVFCGCNAPIMPTAGSNTATQTQITWNWASVNGATGYKYNTVNNYSSAIDNGNVLSFTQTGLVCGTNYTLYIWAYSDCGVSSELTLTHSTTSCFTCGSNLTLTHDAGTVAPVTKTVTYGTVTSSLSGSSKCWITRNLGATSQGTSATDASENSRGWFWQFNRIQGFNHNGSVLTPSAAWQTTINENADWEATNDPCTLLLGSGWRIPTSTEWSNAITNGSWGNYNNTFSSALKLHGAGRLNTAGTISNIGMYVELWSTAQNISNNAYAYYFRAYSSYCNMTSGTEKLSAFPLRCLKD